MSVKVSPKYQVVIPELVRNSLGIKAGSQIEVIAKGKVAYLVPVHDLEDIQSELSLVKNDKKKLAKNLRDKKDREV